MILKFTVHYIPGVDDGIIGSGRGWLCAHRILVQMLGMNGGDCVIIRLILELGAQDQHHPVNVLLMSEPHG